MEEAYTSQLRSIREIKKRSIEDFVSVIRKQLLTMSNNEMVKDAAVEFGEAFLNYPIDQSVRRLA